MSIKPQSVEEYISLQENKKQSDLRIIRKTMREVLPDAQECISWGMPTYRKTYPIIHFAAFKNHIGIYPGAEAVVHFAEALKNYKTSKGAIRIPYGKVDVNLIAEIAKWCEESKECS